MKVIFQPEVATQQKALMKIWNDALHKYEAHQLRLEYGNNMWNITTTYIHKLPQIDDAFDAHQLRC